MDALFVGFLQTLITSFLYISGAIQNFGQEGQDFLGTKLIQELGTNLKKKDQTPRKTNKTQVKRNKTQVKRNKPQVKREKTQAPGSGFPLAPPPL